MSLLISGLNLPNDKPVTLFITSNRNVYLEGVLLSGKAVHVPVHGRLIDADALRTDWLENGENEYVYDTNAFLDSLDNAPTIIPAEEEAK